MNLTLDHPHSGCRNKLTNRSICYKRKISYQEKGCSNAEPQQKKEASKAEYSPITQRKRAVARANYAANIDPKRTGTNGQSKRAAARAVYAANPQPKWAVPRAVYAAAKAGCCQKHVCIKSTAKAGCCRKHVCSKSAGKVGCCHSMICSYSSCKES